MLFGCRNRITKRIWPMVILSAVLFLDGCSSSIQAVFSQDTTESSWEDVPLDEPAQPIEGWEKVVSRKLYDVKIYPAVVVPYTEEYAFPLDVTVDRYEIFPGQSVRKGDVLVRGNTESIDESIDALKERILTMEEDYLKYQENVEESLRDPEEQAENLLDIVLAYEEIEPEMYETVSSGDVSGGNVSHGDVSGGNVSDGDVSGGNAPVVSQAYQKWWAEHHRYEGQYRILAHQNDTARRELYKRSRLYELDHAYLLDQLQELLEKKNQHILTSSMSGEVAAFRGEGSRVRGGDAVVAVADSGRKLLKCDYINSAAVEQAADIYALIDGVRYEVAYQAIPTSVYNQMVYNNETVRTTFTLLDAGDEVAVGREAVIVYDRRAYESTLTLSLDAIHYEGSEAYVYIRQGEDVEARPVTLGKNDGTYIQIISGLEEGDEVLSSGETRVKKSTAVLEKGDFQYLFTASSDSFYYPLYETVENPVTYGTTYFEEYLVKQYQYVTAGEAIARIRVKGDAIGLQRLQRQLDRLKERTLVLIEEDEEDNEDLIEQRQEQIAELEEQIAQMTRDYDTTTIVASQSGVIGSLTACQEGDILKEGNELATIVNVDVCYLLVNNRGQVLHYGSEVAITYQDESGETKEAAGRVVNLLPEDGISNGLSAGYSMVLLPTDVARLSVSRQMYASQFRIDAVTREMKNVVLVPVKAVRLIGDQTYVSVVEENGDIVQRSFIAGGSNTDYYWVVDGLTEGMEVCLE